MGKLSKKKKFMGKQMSEKKNNAKKERCTKGNGARADEWKEREGNNISTSRKWSWRTCKWVIKKRREDVEKEENRRTTSIVNEVQIEGVEISRDGGGGDGCEKKNKKKIL